MGCHPSHSLSYLSEGFKPPTRYVYEIILDYESRFFGTVSKVRHDKIHALVLHRRVCWVISEDSQKSWHAKEPHFFGWYKMVQTQLVGAFTSIHLGGWSQLTFFFCGWTNQPVDLLTPLSIDSSTIDPTDVGCFHQLIAKKLSKIAKSDERRPPITYLVPSVIPLSHHSG